MVVSKLNPAVIYTEEKKIDPEDIGHKSFVYEINVYPSETIAVVLGKLKYIFADKNVLYFPIYAVIPDDIVRSQIGVFEFESLKMGTIMKNGELDISRITHPLLYSFVSESYIRKLDADPAVFKRRALSIGLPVAPTITHSTTSTYEPDPVDTENPFKLNVPASKISSVKRNVESALANGVFAVDKDRLNPNNLPEETETIADELRKEYRESAKNSWIEKHMKNNNYRVRDILGDGDCYFTCVVQAFDQIGRKTTPHKLRSILANEVSDELFTKLREFYLSFEPIIKRIDTRMKGIQREINKLKKETRDSLEKNPQNIEKTKELTTRFEGLKIERLAVEKERNDNIGYMEKRDTLDKYREYILTQGFYADEWAISTLERILNFKTIILSHGAFDEGATDNVMKCGIADNALLQRGTFTPEFYIMVSHKRIHYDLITYRDKAILQFTEIPFDIKMLILNKCLERNAGPYYLIQDFRNLKTRLGIDPDEGRPADYADEEGNGDLYDDAVHFIIHSRAHNNKTKPGKADGEIIATNRVAEFIPLSQMVEWRKVLDDSWMDPNFKLKIKSDPAHTWSSVFHYTEGAKFRMGHPEAYATFAIESNSATSTDIQLAKSHKDISIATTVPGKRANVKPKPDVDYVLGRNIEERDKALRAKFKSNPEFDKRKILLATKNALLLRKLHNGEAPEPDIQLMRIRKELQMES